MEDQPEVVSMSNPAVQGGGLPGWGHRVQRDPDDAAVLRLCWGERLPSCPAERREATRLLTRQGESTAAIARRLGVADRTVTRYRRTS